MWGPLLHLLFADIDALGQYSKVVGGSEFLYLPQFVINKA
jgi:hypothetical protein